MLTTDITMLFPDGKNMFLNVDSLKNLILTQKEDSTKLVAKEVISFDAVCTMPQNADVFLSTEQGSLVWVSCNDERMYSQILMTSKSVKKKICEVKTMEIHGRYHLFYCLDSEKRYLVHQVVSREEAFKPCVIDTIGRHFVYDVAVSEDSDIHIVYQTGEHLSYRRYVYSEKRYTDPKKLCSANARDLCISSRGDEVFVLFSEKTSGIMRIYLTGVSEGSPQKNIMSLSGDCNMCLNCAKDGIIVHTADGGVCYEIKSSYNLEVRKPEVCPKCSSVQRIRCANDQSTVRAYPVNRHRLPPESYKTFEKEAFLMPGDFAPAGREAEDFANRNSAFFADKMAELQNKDLLSRLERIEEIVANLSASFEKFLEETQSPPS